ncbi:MAG: MBL fold metallo-hydrolase, partial [Porphyromonadaceae bacterium]|nr:MBL fold metallo-hydrolase [Porphyromonadaceae bacterium]
KDNNHPELCWKTIENRLFNEGIRVGKDVTLTTLKRTQASPLYVLVP